MSLTIRRVLRCVIFFVLFTLLLMPLTYVMRDGAITEAQTSIRSLSAYPMDVVFMGGSAISMDWWPSEAWTQSGITSVTAWYANQNRALFPDWVTEIRSIVHGPDGQEPFYVFDLLGFASKSDDPREVAFRRGLDARPYSLNRAKTIFKLDSSTLPVPKLELLFDIMKYHDNYGNLTDPAMWERAFFNRSKPSQADRLYALYTDLEFSVLTGYTERVPLNPLCEEKLREVLSICRENGLRAWFVIPAMVETEEIRGWVNSIQDIVREYGYEFTFFNDHLDEMGILIDRDFLDPRHLNPDGTQKCTEWLLEQLRARTSWTDKRTDPAFAEWNRMAEGFAAAKAVNQVEFEKVRADTLAALQEE